ncbi:MAG: hypothetical protein KF685_01580 [Acidobacteria bacterium]|nr:hypothetical protein [Acidobacteriota bacterium]
MNGQIKIVRISKPIGWFVLAAVIICLAIFLWNAVSWHAGRIFAEETDLNQPETEAMAQLAISLSPGDPMTHWLKASEERQEFNPDAVEGIARSFEDIVRLAPYDHRWWIELGRANEHAERMEAAEKALLRAESLAPSYSFPKWQLGNFYLRRGRVEEAFTKLRSATQKNSVYREQVFSLAWDFYGKDPEMVERLADDSPAVRRSLAVFYAQRGASADALRNWNLLSEEEKQVEPQIPRTLAQGLHDQRKFREAVEFSRQSGIDPTSSIETVTNGDMEKAITAGNDSLFGWKYHRAEGKMDVSSDNAVKRSGTRSMRVTFKNYLGVDLANPVQLVAVQPNTSYLLRFWVRGEGLRTGGPPLIQIVNANDDVPLASSQPFDGGTFDWQERTVAFVTPSNCEGILIRTNRVYCGDTCPVSGILWYDDFVLERGVSNVAAE